jgi:hypothetical protein
MSATFEIETRAAERAELEDLLLRLQEAHVVGAWYDVIVPDYLRDKYDAYRKKRNIYEKELEATCIRLLKADVVKVENTFLGDFLGDSTSEKIKFETYSVVLQEDLKEFLLALQVKPDRTEKNVMRRSVATIWRHLEPLLQTYRDDRRTHSDFKTSKPKAEINVLLREMGVYSKKWKDDFNLANS